MPTCFSRYLQIVLFSVATALSIVGFAYSAQDLGELRKADHTLTQEVFKSPKSFGSVASENQQLWIKQVDGGISTFAILDTIAHRNLLANKDQVIFQLEMLVNGAKTIIRADQGWNRVKISVTAKGLKAVLSGRKEPGLESLNAVVTASKSTDQKAILLRLKVDGVSLNASVLRARFPQVVLSTNTSYWTVFYPLGPGVIHSGSEVKKTDFSFVYPGAGAVMQYMAMYDSSSGFHFTTRDPYGSYRIVDARGDSAESIRFSTEQYAPGMGLPGNGYCSDYDTAWQIFKGDWYDAAQIYKRWVAKEAKWYPRKGQPRTPATPREIVQLSSWALATEVADHITDQGLDNVIKFKEYMGVPTAYHIYSWHMTPDAVDDYPHFLPAKPGMVEGVKKLHNAGVYIMPYINGRLWDTRDRGLEDWQYTSVAKPATAKDENGLPYLETYGYKESDGSDVQLAVMCPATEVWQKTMTDITLRLMNEIGVDGVYIDQVAAAGPLGCMDKFHGHPLGGGHWWVDGYNKMLSDIRSKMKGHFLTAECNAEPYIRWFDGYLAWNWQYEGMVPAFQAVYSDKIMVFGRKYAGDAGAVRAKAAQQLVYGEQICWTDPGIISDPVKSEYIRRAIKMRYALRDIISTGQMLRPLKLKCSVKPVVNDWQWGGVSMVTTEAVLTGSWKFGNRIAFLFANVTDKPVTFTFKVNSREYGLLDKVNAIVYKGDGIKTGSISLDFSHSQDLSLGAGEMIAWAFDK